MDGKKIVSVIKQYERFLKTFGIVPKCIDPKQKFSELSKVEILQHAYYLCPGAREYAADPNKFGKANRHLAAIQMCLSFAGLYTLEELMNHNRSVND